MFTKILIANRGEIACRIIKTARRLGILTVAVYSDADTEALHVTMADEAVHIGTAPSKDSYLQMQRVIQAAIQTSAQAIHPGYGFLSENAEFCQHCEDNNIVFIGPPIAAINAMGSKSAAKSIMEKAGVPLVPGYHGDNQDAAELKKHADTMGYPVLLKAAAGGGGKGMRQVWHSDEFNEALTGAKREASNAFNDEVMLVEKYLTQPRHVEIQVFCDQSGNGVYLAERDCSVQRRHQKVIEEAPAPGMTDTLRAQMGQAAIDAAQAINYEGAGTVEFLLDQDGSFYFMEMNTRLQVEHPVTEMITGQDLVEWQLRVAAGENLPLTQQQITINGHAFEARIYAEDPDNNFLPATGTLSFLETPIENEHTRVDTGVRQGDEVSVYYDPMIAKLIVWDEDRHKALRRLNKALSEYRISGVTTNIDFLYNLSNSTAFKNAELDTGFIEKHHQEIFPEFNQDISADVPLAALYLLLEQQQTAQQRGTQSNDPTSPWNVSDAWRLNEDSVHRIDVNCHNQVFNTIITQRATGENIQFTLPIDENTSKKISINASGNIEGNTFYATVDGHRAAFSVSRHDDKYSLYGRQRVIPFYLETPDLGAPSDNNNDNALNAPMNGTIVELLTTTGSHVKKDQALLVMEAMKMEHTIRAPVDGLLTEFYYQAGDLVDGGSELVAIEPTQT
jgi:3-methylcrotonyl-CoA carboxylase alpha subunit